MWINWSGREQSEYSFFSFFDHTQVNIIARMTHQATGKALKPVIRSSKYSCSRLIGLAPITYHLITLNDSSYSNCCICRQQGRECDNWRPELFWQKNIIDKLILTHIVVNVFSRNMQPRTKFREIREENKRNTTLGP